MVAATKAPLTMGAHGRRLFVVPHWYLDRRGLLRWDRFAGPAQLPKYGLAAFPTIWWWDADKAAKVPQRS